MNVKKEVLGIFEKMLACARKPGIPEEKWEEMKNSIYNNMNQFSVKFSSVPFNITPLKITLLPDTKPVRVKLQNYIQNQQKFMKTPMSQLLENGVIYRNSSSSWASAPLIVPKLGPNKWHFTVDPKPINRYSVQNHYPMPNLEH